MELKKQVTSIKLSNKLHKLGIIKLSIFYREWTGAKEDEIEMRKKPDYCPDNINCYTVAELGEMLPDQKMPNKNNNETEADTRAKYLIYLLENKLINR